jgi:hypothetical protein
MTLFDKRKRDGGRDWWADAARRVLRSARRGAPRGAFRFVRFLGFSARRVQTRQFVREIWTDGNTPRSTNQ